MYYYQGKRKKHCLCFFVVETICRFVLNIPSLDNGYSVVQGIYMYLLGALCRTDDIQERFKSNSKLLKVIFVIFWLLNGLLSYILYIKGHGSAAWRMFSYNNPIVVFMAVVACLSVIHCSKKLEILDNLGRLSQYTLSIYLLTDYDPIRQFFFLPLCFLESIGVCWKLLLFTRYFLKINV